MGSGSFMFFVLVLDLGFPGDSDGKESACNTGDLGLISGSGRFPGKGNGYPFQYSCLENSMGQRSPVGYSPWCCRESDMTERLTLFSLLYLIYRPHGSLSGKGPACQCRRRRRLGFDPWVGKIPWSRKWHPTLVSLPGKFHGQRRLVGFSPWGCEELDTTE